MEGDAKIIRRAQMQLCKVSSYIHKVLQEIASRGKILAADDIDIPIMQSYFSGTPNQAQIAMISWVSSRT
jgi:hypothetical protein